ncbi:MAG TPA: hypothetical protein EYP20_06425, partial [Aigarchaeota archaeon]|nr:hypothetical protein [Aigarchaeota archaeon]
AHQPIKHSYPHCWRHKTPIIFRATQQWFISMAWNPPMYLTIHSQKRRITSVPNIGPSTSLTPPAIEYSRGQIEFSR